MNTRKIIGSFILFGLLSNIHVRSKGMYYRWTTVHYAGIQLADQTAKELGWI